MAADVLLYGAHDVPVGADQAQHVELMRTLAGRFNARFGRGTLRVPQALTEGAVPRVMSLADGTSKMSKSDPAAARACVFIDDPDDAIIAKVQRARTGAHSIHIDVV